jgi:hypothetical protein
MMPSDMGVMPRKADMMTMMPCVSVMSVMMRMPNVVVVMVMSRMPLPGFSDARQ